MSEDHSVIRKYSVEEIAAMINLGKTKTRELLDANVLPVTKIGRQYFTSREELQKFFAENRHKTIYY